MKKREKETAKENPLDKLVQQFQEQHPAMPPLTSLKFNVQVFPSPQSQRLKVQAPESAKDTPPIIALTLLVQLIELDPMNAVFKKSIEDFTSALVKFKQSADVSGSHGVDSEKSSSSSFKRS